MEWLISYRQLLNKWLQWFMLLIAGMLVGIFLNTLTHSTSVYAADATWDGHDLTYSNKKYTRLTDNNKVKKFNLPDNSLVYVNEDKNKKEVKVIYFPSGEISSLSSATYAVYSFTPPDTYNQTDTSTISIDPPSENSTGTSCDVQGIGWFICPVSNWLAESMDWMYGQLQTFLKVQPLETTNQNSGIYLAWVIMRNISNVAFIVAFLVIIYSQLTSVGISNYGVKKMIPRLVIAAVLVNLSFTICAILLDLSNIAGYAFQDAFMGIKNTISTVGENISAPLTWQEITFSVLSNGAVLAGVPAGAAVVTGLALTGELLPMLLTALVGLGLILLLVLLIFAARQALIIILIIISPLAFVCYLLPGTEKWFKKWRDTFVTMLLFFPAFAVVFGGAQLAGIIIIQNATGPNGGMMQILGMMVQVIPLAITPLIMKFSGGVLGKFAGIVNDKNKGLYDRTKNWASDWRNIRKNEGLAKNMGRANPNRLRRYFDHKNRARKQRLDTSQKKSENAYKSTGRYKRLDMSARQATRRADLLSEQDSNRYLEATQGYMADDIYDKRPHYDRALRAKFTKYSNWRDAQQAQFMSEIKDLETEIAVSGLIKNNAQRQQHSEFAEQLINSKELREKAGGNVFKDANGNLIGANAALASAIATSRSEYAKSVDEAHQIMKHYKLSSGQRQKISLGNSVTLSDGTVLDSNNIFVREAAIEEQIKYGTATEVAELLSELPPEFYSSAASALAESGVKNKASFLGGKLIDDMLKGDINNRDDLMNYFADWLQGGKYKPETLATTDADAVKLLMEAVNTTSVLTNEGRQDLKEAIDTILTDKRLSANATKATKEQFKIFRNML